MRFSWLTPVVCDDDYHSETFVTSQRVDWQHRGKANRLIPCPGGYGVDDGAQVACVIGMLAAQWPAEQVPLAHCASRMQDAPLPSFTGPVCWHGGVSRRIVIPEGLAE
jgi:hypothetical protein